MIYLRFPRDFTDLVVLGCFSGTGSYPPLENGLQRRKRHVVSAVPFNAPNRSIASSPYSEQVGQYLQRGAVLGEMADL